MNSRALNVIVLRTPQYLIILLLFFLFSCHNTDQKRDDKAVASSDTSSVSKKIDELTTKLKDSPKNSDLLHERAKLYVSIPDFNSAYTDMMHALLIDSTKAPYYLTIADIYFALNKTRYSKEALEKCLKLDSRNVEANLKLAELYLFVQDYEKTIAYIDAALKIDVHNPKAYFMKGMTFKESKDTAKAISSFQTAIEQNPKYYEAFIQLGIIFTAKRNTIALQYLNSAISLRPSSVEAYYDRGYYMQESGNISKAVQDYNIILQLDPTYKSAHYNLGYINYEFVKNNEQALRHFTDAINSDSKYTEAYYMRGLCYEGLGNKNAAATDFKKALELDVEYDLAKEGLQRVTK